MIKALLIYLLLLNGLILLSSCTENPDMNDPFVKAELKWRKDRDERMKKPNSWLTIAGLFWLEEGVNNFGSNGDNDVILPAYSAAPYLGTLTLRNGVVELKTTEASGITIDGQPVTSKQLHTDMDEKRDEMELGQLRFWIIKRGDRYALRLRDLSAKRFKEYHGIDYYPISKDYRVFAKLVPYPEPKKEIIPTVVGTEEEFTIPGYLEFDLLGIKHRLDPFVVESDSTVYFLIIKDATSGKTTYGAGRYMYPEILADGRVELNFNRAYNPPCAFTPYATCPLPPPQNILDIELEAGEKRYSKDH